MDRNALHGLEIRWMVELQAQQASMACFAYTASPISCLFSPRLSSNGYFTLSYPSLRIRHLWQQPPCTQVICQMSKHEAPANAAFSLASTADLSSSTVEVETRFWKWQTYSIRYQVAGDTGPALILIHGFGANCDHWRKNIPVLASQHRVFALDLLGYGYSDKPSPSAAPLNSIYSFENWASQVLAFRADIVKDKAFLICNSVGGIVGLQAALYDSESVRGLILLNISLRMLHIKKQKWFARPFVRTFQNLLRNTDLGKRFFQAVATSQSVKKILCECYHDDSAVTDELVEKILLPGLQPGAVDVFLDFICYSGGPLPEEMLPNIKCPVVIGWGEKDPWEPMELGRLYGAYSCVEEFRVLPNVGHCPQDEAPHLVNPLIEDFVSKHASIHRS